LIQEKRQWTQEKAELMEANEELPKTYKKTKIKFLVIAFFLF